MPLNFTKRSKIFSICFRLEMDESDSKGGRKDREIELGVEICGRGDGTQRTQ